jgi:membrane fusion protein, multidrug efflux system
MKSRLIVVLALGGFLLACSSSDPVAKKQEALLKLKEKISDLQLEVEQIEAELAALGKVESIWDNARKVEIQELALGTFMHFIEVQGTVEGDQVVLVSPEQPGVIREILVREGDFVEKGQVLARLESAAIQAGLQEAQVGLELARTTLDRTARLWEQKIGSEMQYLQAKTNVESLEKRIKSLEAQFAMTTVRSPISGQVDLVSFKLGEMASPGMNGIRVANTNQLKIVARVADSHAGKIRPGTPVKVSLNGSGQNEFEEQVRFVSKVIDPMTRSIIVEIAVKNGGEYLRPNMLAALRFNDMRMDSVMVIPSNTVQYLGDGSYVMVAERMEGGYLAARRQIETGPSYAGTIVVAGGLKPGDLLIINGFSEVTDGAPIAY